jgi:hypothetical protein
MKRRFPKTERLFMKPGRQCDLEADSVNDTHQDTPATTGATDLDFRRADSSAWGPKRTTDATMHCSRLVQSTKTALKPVSLSIADKHFACVLLHIGSILLHPGSDVRQLNFKGDHPHRPKASKLHVIFTT